MIVPAHPLSERERQAALERYDIVDSAPEAEFDVVTQFIATICATPMAVISIIDAERQWFKSRVGLDAPQTPRDVSFCGHAILEPDRLMIVPDAAVDERFAGNPLVTGEPHIRFYAGAPLVTSDGHALGTLCVLDVTARVMTAQQEETLRLAGRTVELLLEQRRRIAELEKITARQLRIEAELRAEIARRHAVEERLTFSSSHDGLTQLPNRTQFMSRLENALERLHAGTAERFAVCFVDLDRFKQMNDTLGHLTGDTLLVDVGRRLSEVIRAGDAVARLGGDEFTLLIGGASTAASADAVAERIANVLRSKLHVRGVEIGITASVGVVLVDETYTSVEEIVRDADIAMYAAKARGRNRSVLFGPPLREEFVHARTVELNLRRALDRGHFQLAYQPIVALNAVAARPHGFEALLRLEQNGTLVSAAHFIDTAEQTGLIVELGYWVLREACAQAARWQGAAFEPIVTTVNVSAKQLSEPGFVQEVKRTLHDYNIVPGLLALEVTESILIADVEASLAIMRELRELGLKIYLDDFGTGYSSLSYLGRFPVDCIKIDRSFVSGAGQGLADPLIVGSVVSLAHQLGVEVVAEGVETERQRDELHRIGCDNAQGFLFSRAVPAAAALELITGPYAGPIASGA